MLLAQVLKLEFQLDSRTEQVRTLEEQLAQGVSPGSKRARDATPELDSDDWACAPTPEYYLPKARGDTKISP